MSQSTASLGQTASQPPMTFIKPCVVMVGGLMGSPFGGGDLGIQGSNVSTRLICWRPKSGSEAWMGFGIQIPLGQSNEANGFGIIHDVDLENHTVKPTNSYRLRVKFPLGQFQSACEPLPAAFRQRFPAAKTDMSVLHVNIGGLIEVDGLGMPFANTGHLAEGWLQGPNSVPVAGNKTLLGIIDQKQFTFIIDVDISIIRNEWTQARLPPQLNYPYGNEHSWNLRRQVKMLKEINGPPFNPSWSFKDDQAHVTVLVQSQVQEIMWLHHEAREIGGQTHQAYFAPQPSCEIGIREYYTVVPLTNEFLQRHEMAWKSLQQCPVTMQIYRTPENTGSVSFPAQIVSHSGYIPALSNKHPLASTDLVLRVRLPDSTPDGLLQIFESRLSANVARKLDSSLWNRISLDFNIGLEEYERRVNAVCNFLPNAPPTKADYLRTGLDDEEMHRRIWRMSMHRDLLRGRGFYRTLRYGNQDPGAFGQFNLDRNTSKTMERASIPVLNFMTFAVDARIPNVVVSDLRRAILEEVFPGDRNRFARYLSNVHLGLGIFTAGSGFGRTNVLAAATLCMVASEGKVFASAPTHVAVDKFAACLDKITTKVAVKYNDNKPPGHRLRRKMVVRAYEENDEYRALCALLRQPGRGDDAAPVSEFGVASEWKFHLSAAYWLLIALGSCHVRPIQPIDSLALHRFQGEIDAWEGSRDLCALVQGEISWDTYCNGHIAQEDDVKRMLKHIVNIADIVAADPSLAHREPSLNYWKSSMASGIAIDEAASMCRPDLYSVWGNTLLPCLLAGDENQATPIALTQKPENDEGNAVNRFARDAAISPVEFFKGMGWPAYRLRA